MNIPLLVSLLIALAVFCLSLAFVLPPVTRLRHKRAVLLQRLAGKTTALPQSPASLRKEGPSPIAATSKMPDRSALRLFVQANTRFLLLTFFYAGVIGYGLSWLMGVPMVIGFGLTVLIAVLARYLRTKAQAAKRRTQIADAIPEGLEMIVRSLRVGMPIAAALLHAGERLSGPLGEEFRTTAEKVSFGQDITSALYAMAKRGDNADLRFFAAAVSMQMTSGGNLADLLERLAMIARARQQLWRKVDSITSEARWSGRFLSAFPIVASGGLYVMNPAYFDSLVQSSVLVPVLVGTFVLIVINVWYMRWLCQLD